MANFLILENTPAVVINDVKDAINADKSFCVWRGSAMNLYMKENYPNAKIIGKESIAECIPCIRKGESDILVTPVGAWDELKGQSKYNKNCDLEWVGRMLKSTYAAFPIGDSEELCTSILNDALTIHLLDMKIDGSFDKIWEEYHKQLSDIDCDFIGSDESDSSNEENIQVTVSHVGGLFISHSVVLTLALAISVIRCLWQRPETRREISSELVESLGGKSLKKAASAAKGIRDTMKSRKRYSLDEEDELGENPASESQHRTARRSSMLHLDDAANVEGSALAKSVSFEVTDITHHQTDNESLQDEQVISVQDYNQLMMEVRTSNRKIEESNRKIEESNRKIEELYSINKNVERVVRELQGDEKCECRYTALPSH